MLSNDSARAFYGPGHVKAAQELGAIGTLLLTDTVLLVHDVNKVCPPCATTQQPCNMLHNDSLCLVSQLDTRNHVCFLHSMNITENDSSTVGNAIWTVNSRLIVMHVSRP